jgi:hypothetical protein
LNAPILQALLAYAGTLAALILSLRLLGRANLRSTRERWGRE